MLVWATEFPVHSAYDESDVIRIAKTWLSGSPHYDWSEDELPDPDLGETLEVEKENQVVTVSMVSTPDIGMAGVRHKTINDDREWVTEVVALRSIGDLRVSVRTNCHLLQAGTHLPRPKKPYVVKLLLQSFGGGNDSGCIVGDTPIFLHEADVEIARQLLSGEKSPSLPVVYLSSRRSGKPSVNALEIAQKLGGMAHVIVEPSRYFSFALGRHIPELNPYNGAIAVCWPRGEGSQIRLLDNRFETQDELELAVLDNVRRALTYAQHNRACSWTAISQLITKQRIEKLKEEGSASVEEWVEAFGADEAANEKRLQEANVEIERLKAEIRRLQNFGNGSGQSILTEGKEKNLYPGEIQDAVVQAISLGKSTLCPDGRMKHIVDDILAVNKPTGVSDEISEGIKTCFSDGGRLGNTQKSKLRELGFELDESGGHIKAQYCGDARYTFTFAKTPSDHRSGKNTVSDICKKLFK